MATPPAKVALRTISISSFPFVILAIKHAEITLVEIDKRVLITVLCYWRGLPTAALKEGQYINKKRVPIIAIKFDEYVPLFNFFSSWIAFAG